MNKYTRFGTSTLSMIVLHIAAASIFVGIWSISVDAQFVVLNLLVPDLVQDVEETNRVMANEIISYFHKAFFFLTLWSLIMSFFWLAYSSLASVERPGQARRLRWFWLYLMTIGIAGACCIFGYYFLEIENFYYGVSDLLNTEKQIPITISWGFIFFVFYFLCGSLFTTPKIARTAVPFAARVVRS